ncbi:Dolichyl-phosphate-mannose-protein mannosyltransferase-domain-containing protein [Mortierella sp. GBAus27b]|nr:Dolichyl-phosphate-mannose-protein mannosyltransferase-domain-containing protein [Mortierella sp. GBAus27b]
MEKQRAVVSWEESKLLSYSLSRHDWATLAVLTAMALVVRGWKLDSPGEVVMDEAHVGNAMNGYITRAFTFDRHPPLGRLILAGISSLVAGYRGDFDFEEIGDPYPVDLPFVPMRAAMTLMGALCAPMAYVTLKAIGQDTTTAIAATVLITFDSALTASSRLMTLEAPLMFFTALSFMSWSMFSAQSSRPFSGSWWSWLATTGLAVSGALTVKANGVLTFLAIGLLTTMNMFSLATNLSINSSLWARHFLARASFLVVLPVLVYLCLFQLHLSLQTDEPVSMTRSAQAEYDLNLLSYPMRDTLSPYLPESDQRGHEDVVWADIVYGSVIQLRSELRPAVYVHSFNQSWTRGSKQQQVTGYEYPDLNTHWILSQAPTTKEEKAGMGEIPDRLRYLRHGEKIKLRHMSTRKCLHSHNVRTMGQTQRDRYCEVSAYGTPNTTVDKNDWWVVEVVDMNRMEKVPKDADIKVKALETTFRLKHWNHKCYLHVTEDLVPKNLPGGPGRRELACLKRAKILPNTVWRITLNDHDYLPMDTPIASYPRPSFWQKFVELHKLMWKQPRVFEQPLLATKSTPPLSWPLAHAKSIVTVWRKVIPRIQGKAQENRTETQEVQQISVIANPIVWWTGFLGVMVFLGAHVVLQLRMKRGYVDGEATRAFKQGLSNAITFFAAWAILYLPYVLFLSKEVRRLTTHHYFPALYCSILLGCTVLSSIATACMTWRPATRACIWMTLSVAAMAVFIQLSPLTYGTRMTMERYDALEQWIYGDPSQRPSYIAMEQKRTLAYRKRLEPPAADESEIGLLFSQPLTLPRPQLRQRPPVLKPHYPAMSEALPRDDIFMTPAQRPPQLWDVNQQKGKPNMYQRQQMQPVLEAMRKEDEEKKRQEEEEKKKKTKRAEARRKEELARGEEKEKSRDQDIGKERALIQEEAKVQEQGLEASSSDDPAAKDTESFNGQQHDSQAKTPEQPNHDTDHDDTPSLKSEFVSRLERNAVSYVQQKLAEGHPYGSLDGQGIPRHAPRDLDGRDQGGDDRQVKCPLLFPDRNQVSFGHHMKRMSDYTRARAKDLWRDAVFREGIQQERLKVRLTEQRQKA